VEIFHQELLDLIIIRPIKSSSQNPTASPT